MSDDRYRWRPATAAQGAALDSQADILFFGGSAGSLKTETLLMDAVQEYENPNLRGIIFRQSFNEMTDLVDKTQRLYVPLGGKWVGNPSWVWKFPSGARIRFAYIKTDLDWKKYLGPRYSFIGWDESTFHTEKQVRNLIGRLGSTDRTLRLRVRMCSNPGSTGASWHQALFLHGHCPVHNPEECAKPGALYHDRTWPSDGQPLELRDKKTGEIIKRFSTCFIPGKLSDHNLLGPEYAASLSMMHGDEADAMLDGCWCKLEGAYFPFLNKRMIKPLAEVGIEWWHNHWISIDYGLGASSAAAGLYVRTPPSAPMPKIPGILSTNYTDPFPQGRIRKIGELERPDKSVEDFAKMVVEKFILPAQGDQARRIIAVFADPANFNPDYDLRHGTGGKSISDQIDEVLAPYGLSCQPANNQRAAGWQLISRMLRSGELEITDECPKTFESFRTRMRDPEKTADVLKVKGDPMDDVADETRYAVYSWIQPADKPRELVLKEAIEGIDRSTPEGITSSMIRYQQAADRYDQSEEPIRLSARPMRLGRRR